MAKEKFKTMHGVFDNFTSLTLFKLSEHIRGLKSPISIGKESNVFTAENNEGRLVAVKIYRLETCDFNRMYDYIKSDPRFTGLLKQKRKVIFAWAQREYRNLMIAREAGVNSPMPIAVKNNVLLEEFIGGDDPAPRLVNLKPKHPEKFFENLLIQLARLYSKKMTHGDLSAFNILNFNEKPVLIDFSQATLGTNPRFEELLARDIKTVCNYFIKLGVKANANNIINKLKKQKP